VTDFSFFTRPGFSLGFLGFSIGVSGMTVYLMECETVVRWLSIAQGNEGLAADHCAFKLDPESSFRAEFECRMIGSDTPH
jgi:hypothetical protein